MIFSCRWESVASIQSVLSRPCTGCSKKGYAADQCIDGCDSCRRARVRCEGGKPCQRCRDMHTDCLEEVVSTVSTSRQEFSAVSIKTPRANGTDRAKLACTNCRRDNKKVRNSLLEICLVLI